MKGGLTLRRKCKQISPRLPAAVFLVTLAALIPAVFSSGCGQELAAPPQEREEAVEVELGAAPTGEDVLTADDLLTDTGSSLVYLANTPGTQAAVSFSLSGPWTFITGPATATLTIDMIDVESAPSSDQFPEAAIAARSTFAPQGGVDYNFQSKDDSSWLSHGRIGPEGRLRAYSAAVRALVFPAAVGTAWTETYTETENGRIMNIIAENLVVSQNRLSVPAGTFEAFLLQTRVTSSLDEQQAVTWDYIWFVPSIGRAAEIVSLPGEQNEVFISASAFYRLDSFRTP